ncbi:DHHC palmitoyltransferase-domain-containing protein [Sparassis latifolia]
MATPHSLPSASHRTVTHLPFSPNPTSNPPLRIPIQSRPHSGSTSGNVPPSQKSPTRPKSVVSSRSHPSQNPITAADPLPMPVSASIPLFHPRPVHSSSTTHAGGILPSASFFHPSRPSYPPPSPPPARPSRPSSAGSVMSTEAPTFDVLRLAPLSEHQIRESDATDSIGHSTEEFKDQEHTLDASARSASVKPSREALLPIGPSRTSRARRPTVVTQSGPYGLSETNVSAGGRMRDSFEKLFKRGFSFDGSHKSPATSPTSAITSNGLAHTRLTSRSIEPSPISPTAVARMTFELNVARSTISPRVQHKHSLSPTQASTSSLNMSFVSHPPPDMKVSLSMVPVVNRGTGKPVRNYQLHQSRNRFFLGGRLLTGGDSPRAFVASLIVVLGIAGVWFSTTCVWWWHHKSPAVAAVGVYMCLLTISSMLATAFRDPGILPRDLDPEPPFAPNSSSESLRAPLPRDLKVRAGFVRTKYCPTCRTYRPPRSCHCKMCDNCVDGCDHHCQWVNNCIGRRNYTSFFTFLLSSVVTIILVICTSALHLYLLTRDSRTSFRRALATAEGVGSAVGFSMAILVLWPVMALLVYHLRVRRSRIALLIPLLLGRAVAVVERDDDRAGGSP